jgi:hypothetical protein
MSTPFPDRLSMLTFDLQDLNKGFKAAGFKPEVRTLASFQDGYGLAVGGEEDEDDDEEDDDDDDDDDAESDEEGDEEGNDSKSRL